MNVLKVFKHKCASLFYSVLPTLDPQVYILLRGFILTDKLFKQANYFPFSFGDMYENIWSEDKWLIF